MVRDPTKTCPNLHRVLTETDETLLSRFLSSTQFKMLDWLKEHQFSAGDPGGRERALAMLNKSKMVLLSMETEAARVVMISGGRGQFALDGLTQVDPDIDTRRLFLKQGDELERSLWCWLDRPRLFEATENILHQHLYRRYDKHYQTFLARPATSGGRDDGSPALQEFLKEVTANLDRGGGCRIERFDIPEEGNEPEAEMYIVRHPNLATAAREINDEGVVSKFYFRPPGEAMIVFVPSTGRIHVRADTRSIRHIIRKAFVEKALAQEVSHEPADFQAYDISRFMTGFDLLPLEDPEASIKQATLIRLDASIESLSNRISISAPKNRGVGQLVANQPGLRDVFARVIAIRFVEIAVLYRRAGASRDETLNVTISDGNTCSLLSCEDPYQHALGSRLLRLWGLMVEGRAPGASDFRAILPAILALWDISQDTVQGAWLIERKLDVGRMKSLGFIVPIGWDDGDLIEHEDIGAQDAKLDESPGRVNLALTEEQMTLSVHPERYRQYRVRSDWVAQFLRSNVVRQFGSKAVEVVIPDLLFLGTLQNQGATTPVYLARRLNDEKRYAEVDSALRLRSDLGLGLVLNAGNRAGFSIAANVLLSFSDYLVEQPVEDVDASVLDMDRLRSAFLRHQNLAAGGETVELAMAGENSGTLSVPGRGTIEITGRNRLIIVQRLVDAHRSGSGLMKTADMTRGFGEQSLSNIFGRVLWQKLRSDFLHSPGKGKWKIAV